MATTQKNLGKCYICKKEFSKTAIKRHILNCNNLGNGKSNYFLIKVEDTYDKRFWLYIQVKTNTPLDALDDFLRNIWLECCGHLSAFIINGVTYDKYYEDDFDIDFDEKEDMSEFKLKDILNLGMSFKHQYDFGSTTTLKLTITDKYTGINSLESITLLARNNKTEYTCEYCGDKASYILHDYEFDNFKPICDTCIEELSEKDEEMLSVVITNSPRMGICGYEGANDVYELEED